MKMESAKHKEKENQVLMWDDNVKINPQSEAVNGFESEKERIENCDKLSNSIDASIFLTD
jgi:hypothetical protein